MAPHYAKAATALKQEHPEIVLAKVDADQHKDIGTKFNLTRFPTLKWFTDGEASEYTGGRTDDTIVSWIGERLASAAAKALPAASKHDATGGPGIRKPRV